MAGTESAAGSGEPLVPGPEPIEHPLEADRLDGLLALSGAAGWNQAPEDWTTMLALGRGWGLSDPDGTLLASTVVLPYEAHPPGPGFAWVSMVLVLPAHRRRGLASRLLRSALAWLENRGLTPFLDATPQGEPVYRREGFEPIGGFARLERAAAAAAGPMAAAPEGITLAPLQDAHWPALAALDASAFGGRREPLLRSLAQRQPALARVALRGAEPMGFVLGRPGRVATQVGPLVCPDPAVAAALLDAALAAVPGRVFLDLPDAQQAFGAAVATRGFVAQRPFTRMLRPAPGAAPTPAPGDPSAIRLVAGPELG